MAVPKTSVPITGDLTIDDTMRCDPKSLEGQSAVNSDDLELIRMGKKPKMKRMYNFWTLCAYQVMMCSTWACVVVLYGTIFDIGGPVGLLYGSIAVALGQTVLMASLAEYCGIWPTAGGQQFYVQVLASPKWRPLLSYLVGWALVTAEMSVSASCALQNSNIIGSFVQTVHPDFDWTSWETFFLYLAFITLALVMNMAPRMLPAYSSVGALLTIGGFFAWAVTVLVKAPKSDARFVFATFLNNTGYASSGWVFIMGFYNSIYGLYGTDAMMHLVEEMRNAAEDAPASHACSPAVARRMLTSTLQRAMVWSMVFAGITTIVTDVILLFTCGDYASYAEELAPYVSWFADISGSLYGGGLFISILFCIGNLLICVGVMASCSRLGWRMAEEKALPFSPWLATIHPTFGIPWNMMLVMFVAEIVVGLISLGSDLAFYAIVSGSGVFFQMAYIAPICCIIVRGRRILPDRPHFDLGRWALPLNYLSVAWALLVVAMYLSPLYVPVTGAGNIGNMNWACAIVGAEVVLSLGYWFYRARHHYMKDERLAVLDGEAQAPGQIDVPVPEKE